MKVKRLPHDVGPAAWDAILPPADCADELAGAQTADWLIIGAGFAGLSAARRLRQLDPKGRIALLEARRIAQGPAGRNSGFMIDLPHVLSSDDYGGALDHDRKQTAMNRMAIDFAGHAAHEYGMEAEAFIRAGKTNAAAGSKALQHNQDYAHHLTMLGEAHEMLDAKAMREMTGSDYYQGGLYTPGTAMLQPALYVRGLAQGLRQSGVTLFENSPVTGLMREGASWRASTPKGRVSAPTTILAVNGHVESFGFYERRLMHIFLYASMTRALGPDESTKLGGADRWGVTPADPMGTTVRRISGIGGDRIVTRNRVTFDPAMAIGKGHVDAAARHHDRAFRRRFPGLAGIEMEHRWSGQLCLSRNDTPAFGALDEGLFAACCQNGLGTAKGTLAGLAAAELASGASSPAVDFLRQSGSPNRLPPEPFCTIGANALIRWKEFRAGPEM